jgi:hypothetical protein
MKSGIFALPPIESQPTSPAPAPATASVIERRVYVRHFCDIGAVIDAWPARIENISRGGVKVVVSRRFEVGTILRLEIRIPGDDDVFMLPAKVVRVEPVSTSGWGLGCAFVQEISEEEMQELLTNDQPNKA